MNAILKSAHAMRSTLEELVGQLNHATMVTPLSRHFLCRIRRSCANNKHLKSINISDEVLANSCCWMHFLELASMGISMNLIIERRPNNIFILDSCEHRIRGYSLKTRSAFYFKIPAHLWFEVSNNVLKHLAKIVVIWKGVLEREVTECSCTFSGMDSASTIG